MATPGELLKTTEAAVVAGVALRDINRVIDEGVLPTDFVNMENGRHIAPAGCMLIAFYVGSAESLTAKERLHVIHLAASRLRNWRRKRLTALSKEDWTLKHEFLAVDFAPFVISVADRLEKLSAADELVSSSPDILGGAPVIRGTRVPVHDVAASIEAGLSRRRILEAYPALDSEKLDLATLYAKANPMRGRPRKAAPPKGAAVVAERRIPRGKKRE